MRVAWLVATVASLAATAPGDAPARYVPADVACGNYEAWRRWRVDACEETSRWWTQRGLVFLGDGCGVFTGVEDYCRDCGFPYPF